MRRSHLVTQLCVMLALVAPLQAQPGGESALERGRTLTAAFYAGDGAVVIEALDANMRRTLGGEEGLLAFREQLRAELGDEREVVDESVSDEAGYRVYRRVVLFDRAEEPMTVTWAFDTSGRVAGFVIQAEPARPAEAPSPYLDHETRTPLRLPFEGEWMVVWGGRSVSENYHAAHEDQRFAYDLAVEVEGSRHEGEGTSNEDYHCWGRPVLAPGPGTVRVARDGVPDNVPGRMDPRDPPGNHVVLDHGNGEYSFLAHLREGSVAVAPGDRVAPGDTVGLCGNSGNSSEPHLHYHLQDTPHAGEARGMPAQFLDYAADGVPVPRGEPVQGEKIRPGGA